MAQINVIPALTLHGLDNTAKSDLERPAIYEAINPLSQTHMQAMHWQIFEQISLQPFVQRSDDVQSDWFSFKKRSQSKLPDMGDIRQEVTCEVVASKTTLVIIQGCIVFNITNKRLLANKF